MRASTVALAVIAVLAIGALFLSWRGDGGESQDARRLAAPAAVDRPDRAKSRLDNLRDAREAYDRRSTLAESDQAIKQKAEARRPDAPARRELPTRDPMVVNGGYMDELPYDEDDVADVRELRELIINDPDPDERVGAILMLSGNEHPEALSTIIRAMEDTDAEVRLAAVEALGDYSDTIQPGTFDRAMDDPDPEVRFEAVSIIGDMETPDAYAMVRRALDDPDEDVRTLAQDILEEAEVR